MSHYFISTVLLLASSQLLASEKICVSPTHENDIFVCQISKAINIPPLKVAIAMLAHSIEANLNFCQFKPTDHYKKFMATARKDAEVMKAKNWVSSYFGDTSNAPPGFTGNKPEYCLKTFQMLGPRSGETAFYRPK